MPPQRPRWKDGFRIFAAVLGVCAIACSTAKQPVASPPPPSQAIQPAGIQQARQAFSQTRYDEAYNGFENVLEQQQSGSLRIEALYHLAVIDLIRDPKARNFGLARTRLGEVKVSSDYRQGEVEALLELLVTLEDTRATYRKQAREQELVLEQREEEIEQKEEALRSVTETLIGGGGE